jgi:hypothetical protein
MGYMGIFPADIVRDISSRRVNVFTHSIVGGFGKRQLTVLPLSTAACGVNSYLAMFQIY